MARILACFFIYLHYGVYKFNFAGDLLQGFGGNEVFDSPHAVAYYDRTLYVVDTNNDRILRYILSTELD